MHVPETYAYEIGAHEIHAYEGFCEDLARQTTVTHLSQLQLGFRRRRILVMLSHMGFSHRLASKRSVFRSLHGLLGYQRSSALFRPVCLSSTCLSVFNLSVCLQPVCLSPDSQ